MYALDDKFIPHLLNEYYRETRKFYIDKAIAIPLQIENIPQQDQPFLDELRRRNIAHLVIESRKEFKEDIEQTILGLTYMQTEIKNIWQ